MKQTYQGIKHIVLHNSDVIIERPVSWFKPWRNFMANVTLDGVILDKVINESVQNSDVLKLSDFTGKIYTPSERNTDLELNNCQYKGIHPGGNLTIDGGKGKLIPAGYNEVPKWLKLPLGAGADAAAMLGISLLYVAASKGMEGAGMPHWDYDISLILSAGSYLGLRGRNMRCLTTSIIMAAGLTFGEEIIGKEDLGLEDLGKMVGLYPLGGLFGLGARQVKDYLTR